MRIRADQLASSLQTKGLAAIYCISGDEPLQLLESADMIRQFALNNGVEERTVLNVEKGFDWNSLQQTGASLSLFSSRRLIELRLGTQKPGKEGGAALAAYAASPGADNILLISSAKIDKQGQQTRWYKSIEAAGVTIQIWPIEASNLNSWIVTRAREYGKSIQRDAAELIAQKVEGNLLAARQELQKLCLLTNADEITIEDVMSAVNDSARYDVFAMIESACLGNAEHSCRMLRGLKAEGLEPVGIFGAMMWEIRRFCSIAQAIDSGIPRDRVYSEFRVWQQKKAAVSKLTDRLGPDELVLVLRKAHTIDNALKGALRINPWELLEDLILQLAGIRDDSAARPAA